MATAIGFPPILSADLNRSVDKVDNCRSATNHQTNNVALMGFDEKLVVSPYTEEPHLLDLRTLDVPNQLVAKALMRLECLRTDYATAPYIQIFNVGVSRKMSLTEVTNNSSGLRSSLLFKISLQLRRSSGLVIITSTL